jgi:polyisoprenoid-binding protein YceI
MMRITNGVVLGLILAVAGCSGPGDKATGPAAPGKAGAPEPAAAGSAKAPGPGALSFSPATSKIEWVGTKAEGKHVGGFKEFMGFVELPDNDLSRGRIVVEIDTDSLFSDNAKLTGHLKSPDFFDVKTYPKASFATTAIKENKADGVTHTITGDLTLHGVTKSISFPVRAVLADDALTLAGEFPISRKEFGMTYGQGKVDDTVTLKVAVRAPRSSVR